MLKMKEDVISIIVRFKPGRREKCYSPQPRGKACILHPAYKVRRCQFRKSEGMS